MAGTFTVVAIIGLAIVTYIVYKVIKRRSRVRDEEDDVFFEKYNRESEPPLNNSNTGPSDSSYNVATTAAAPDAYPDRAMHYGSTAAAVSAYDNQQHYGGTAAAVSAYNNQQQYGAPANGASAYDNPQQYGVEYPPGTAYAAAAQGGGQYQYTGQAGGYDATAGYAASNGQAHPFADPTNNTRNATAPPIAYAQDAYYTGTAR